MKLIQNKPENKVRKTASYTNIIKYKPDENVLWQSVKISDTKVIKSEIFVKIFLQHF